MAVQSLWLKMTEIEEIVIFSQIVVIFLSETRHCLYQGGYDKLTNVFSLGNLRLGRDCVKISASSSDDCPRCARVIFKVASVDRLPTGGGLVFLLRGGPLLS